MFNMSFEYWLPHYMICYNYFNIVTSGLVSILFAKWLANCDNPEPCDVQNLNTV